MRIGARRTYGTGLNNPPALAGNAIASPNNFSWTVAARITATNNVLDAPDGTKTAATIIPTVTSGTHALVLQSLTATARPWRYRLRVKPIGGYHHVGLTISNNASYGKYVQARFNLYDRTVLNLIEVGGYQIARMTITPLPGGWSLVEAGIKLADANSTALLQADVFNENGVQSYAGDTVSGLGVWYAEFCPE